MRNTRLRRLQTNRRHRHFKLLAIFSLFDRVRICTDEFDAKLFEHAILVQIKGAVQGSLTTHRWQHCIRTLFLNDFFYHLPSDRLDVRNISGFRIGHDRGGVTVHENRAIPFCFQCFACLRS